MSSISYDIYVKGEEGSSHAEVGVLLNLLKTEQYDEIYCRFPSAIPFLAVDVFKDQSKEVNLREIAHHWKGLDLVKSDDYYHLIIENNMDIEPFVELMFNMNAQGLEVYGYSSAVNEEFFYHGRESRESYEGVEWRWLQPPVLLLDLDDVDMAFTGDTVTAPVSELIARVEKLGATVSDTVDNSIYLLIVGDNPDPNHVEIGKELPKVVGEERFLVTLLEQEDYRKADLEALAMGENEFDCIPSIEPSKPSSFSAFLMSIKNLFKR